MKKTRGLQWGGRFAEGPDAEALRFSASTEFDTRLAADDVRAGIAHAEMLGACGVIPKNDAKKIVAGLRRIAREIDAGAFRVTWEQEDVHTAIEQRLVALTGKAGERLHTARSRNDQVATAMRLYLRRAAEELDGALRDAQRAVLSLAERSVDVVMPGYTHLQQAQPVLAAHYCCAWIAMLDRDRGRIADAAERFNLSPLGSAAFAGTPHRIDRSMTARALGFRGIEENSIDAVSDRDGVLELTAACAIVMTHVSRFAEDLVIWSSREFALVRIGDRFTTGSSIMPHKKNPDMAELVRARTGRVVGALMGLLTVMKGVPLTYSRDLQEDKPHAFTAIDSTLASLRVFTGMIGATDFDSARCAALAGDPILTATEIADVLVERGLPFREAHVITGKIVRWAEQHGRALASLTDAEWKGVHPLLDGTVSRRLTPLASIRAKRSAGSTAPREVAAQLRRWRTTLAGRR